MLQAIWAKRMMIWVQSNAVSHRLGTNLESALMQPAIPSSLSDHKPTIMEGNGWHVADIFKCIFFYFVLYFFYSDFDEILFMMIQVTLSQHWGRLMAWCQTGAKPLPGQMMAQFTNAYIHQMIYWIKHNAHSNIVKHMAAVKYTMQNWNTTTNSIMT